LRTLRTASPSASDIHCATRVSRSLTGAHKLHQMTVLSPTQGWSAEVYVANAVPDPAALAPWGKVLDAKQTIAGNATFNLGGTQGSAVLLWLTDLGPSNETAIAEVQIS